MRNRNVPRVAVIAGRVSRRGGQVVYPEQFARLAEPQPRTWHDEEPVGRSSRRDLMVVAVGVTALFALAYTFFATMLDGEVAWVPAIVGLVACLAMPIVTCGERA